VLNSWGVEYLSPSLTSSGGPLNRDAWMPAVSAYRYPTDPTGYVAVSYVSTLFDATSNARVRVVGNWWAEGGTVPTFPLRIDALGTTLTYSVDQTMGRYNGAIGMPHQVQGFMHAWGDQRNIPYTYVYASRTTP